MMKQSLVLSILLLLSSSLIAPIQARNKSHPAKAPVPAPAPSNSDCSTIIYSMMDCLSYLSIPSNETMPQKSCCDAIETVLEYNPKCICFGLESSKDMGIELNNSRALAMPTNCKLAIPAPHCEMLHHGAPTPSASTPDSASPSAETPMTSPSSAESPTISPPLPDSPAVTAPAPSSSGTSNLSFQIMTLFTVMVSSIVYISIFSNLL